MKIYEGESNTGRRSTISKNMENENLTLNREKAKEEDTIDNLEKLFNAILQCAVSFDVQIELVELGAAMRLTLTFGAPTIITASKPFGSREEP